MPDKRKLTRIADTLIVTVAMLPELFLQLMPIAVVTAILFAAAISSIPDGWHSLLHG